MDDIERQLGSAAVREHVDEMRATALSVVTTERGMRDLVGDVQAMATRANQLAREVNDRGISMEIELTTDVGAPTGRLLRLVLMTESGLIAERRDRVRVVRIPNAEHAASWADEHGPVMLVLSDESRTIEWMEIGAIFRRERADGHRLSGALEFAGERFDVMSIRRWRERELGQSPSWRRLKGHPLSAGMIVTVYPRRDSAHQVPTGDQWRAKLDDALVRSGRRGFGRLSEPSWRRISSWSSMSTFRMPVPHWARQAVPLVPEPNACRTLRDRLPGVRAGLHGRDS